MTQFDKFSILDILISTPYDLKWNLSGWLTEEVFYENLFVRNQSFNEKKKVLDNFLKYKSYQMPFFCFIEGYAGTGKTTFIHWYSKNSNLGDMQHAFIDLSKGKSHTHSGGDSFSGEDLFKDYFISLLSKMYKNYNEQIEDLLFFLDMNSVSLAQSFEDDFFIKLNMHFSREKMPPIQSDGFISFIRKITYTEMMLLVMLIYNKYPEIIASLLNGGDSEGKISNQLLLFFDNMDAMKMEDKASKIPKEIASIYYHYYTSIISEFESEFHVDRKINFVFCMRDSVFSVINPQHNDFFQLKHLHFGTPAEEAKRIFYQRKRLADDKEVQVDTLEAKMLNSVYNDRNYLSKSYLPLFNYNIRKFSHFISIAADYANSDYMTVYDQIMSSPENHLNAGARGIFYYLMIKCMKERDFISNNLLTKHGQPTKSGGKGLLNMARIILTILHNKTQYELDVNNKTEHLSSVGLFDIYKEFARLFENHIDDFMQTLRSLFLFYEENWCHLISVSNLQMFDEAAVDKVAERITEYEKCVLSGNQEKAIRIFQEINNIKVRINSSGYIFLKDIIRHYEYHSIKSGNEAPLFTCKEIYRKSQGVFDYEFLINIENTKENAFSCIQSLRNYLDENDSTFRFDQSIFCFRIYSHKDHVAELDDEFDDVETFEITRPGQLLINRIIDTHTNYIDVFRRYILNDLELMKEYSYKMRRSIKDITTEINTKLCKVIGDYLEKYYDQGDDRLASLKALQLINLEKIIEDGQEEKFYRALNHGRNHRAHMPLY